MARISRKRVFIIIILLISSCLFFLTVVAWRIATTYEDEYFRKLYSPPSPHSGTDKPDPANKTAAQNVPPVPLIRNVFQLSSFSWENDLNLHLNGTAKYPMQSRWIYVGGTPKEPRSWWEKISLFSPPGKGSCDAAPRTCSSFNAGFNELVEVSRRRNPANHIPSSLAFVDCDSTPFLCDVFRLQPITLLYLETRPPCLAKKDYSFVCSARWTYVSFPLRALPFARQVRVGGRLVPAFPTPLEQLWSVMMWDGMMEGLGFPFQQTLAGEEGDGYTFEGVSKEDTDLYETKLREVEAFLAIVLRKGAR